MFLGGVVPVVYPCFGFEMDAQLVEVGGNIVTSSLNRGYCLIDREERGGECVDPFLLKLRADNETDSSRWDLEAYSVCGDTMLAEQLDQAPTMRE